MFANLNILSFGELIRKCAFSSINRGISSNNLQCVGMCNSTVLIHSKIWVWWLDGLINALYCVYMMFLLNTQVDVSLKYSY